LRDWQGYRTWTALQTAPTLSKWISEAWKRLKWRLEYKSSGAFVKYSYNHSADRLSISLSGSYEYVQLSLPIPGNYTPGDLKFGGKKKKYIMASINQSNYLIADADVQGDCEIILDLRKKR
jgi:hypothetical protein